MIYWCCILNMIFLPMSRSRFKEYLPITGLAEYNKLSAKLIFGADRYCSVGLIYPFPPVGDFLWVNCSHL